MELVHRGQDAGAIGLAAHLVEVGQQPFTVVALGRQRRVHDEVLHRKFRRIRIADHGERRVGRPQVGGAEAEHVHVAAALVHAGDVVGQADVAALADLGRHRADHRIIVDEAGRLLGIAAGEEALVAAAVVGEVVGDGADERVAIGDAGMARQMLADLHARHIGRDRLEVAAVLGRGVGLHVVGFHVRRPARQPQQDDRRVVGSSGFLGLGAEAHYVGQADAAEGQHPSSEEGAARRRRCDRGVRFHGGAFVGGGRAKRQAGGAGVSSNEEHIRPGPGHPADSRSGRAGPLLFALQMAIIRAVSLPILQRSKEPPMAHANGDRNLLFGILALQMDFIGRDALVRAMHAWVLDKDKPLGQILVEQQALGSRAAALLDAVVQQHLKQHGDDAEKSLASVSSVGSACARNCEQHRRPRRAGQPGPRPSRRRPRPGADLGAPAAALGGHVQRRGPAFPRPAAARRGRPGQGVRGPRPGTAPRGGAEGDPGAPRRPTPRAAAGSCVEAEITGGLEHPGIVPVYGLGAYADGRPFYAMRFIKGDTLKDAIERFHQTQGR